MLRHRLDAGPATALGLLVLLGAARAGAEARSFDVPPECGTERGFEAEVERLAGPAAARAHPAFVRITHEPAGAYRLVLKVGDHVRELEHADCRVLVRSAAVIAAASVREDAARAATVGPPVAPAARAEHPARPAVPGGRRRAVRGSVSGGVGLALGVLPGASGVFELRGSVSSGSFGASLAGHYLPARFVADQGRGASIFGLGMRAAGTMTLVPALALSLGVAADWLSGHGSTGVTAPREDSAWLVAPSLELAVSPLRTEHFSLELGVEGRYHAIRPVFSVNGFGDVYRVPRFGTLLVLRGAYGFP